MVGLDPLLGVGISHCRIFEKLGGAGMGPLHKVEDIRLHRWMSRYSFPIEVAAGDREDIQATLIPHANCLNFFALEDATHWPLVNAAGQMSSGTDFRDYPANQKIVALVLKNVLSETAPYNPPE